MQLLRARTTKSVRCDHATNARQQRAINVGPALNNESTDSSNMVNTQLSYDID